jgi:hypothetical protein
MLEMVIVAPVLLLLLFAIAEFGIAFAQWQTLSNAAREGARVGVVFRDPAIRPRATRVQCRRRSRRQWPITRR